MLDKLAVVKSKIVSAEQAKHIVAAWRLTNQKIAFTNGCFDILHAGHVISLAGAASFGNRLIVGVNADASVKRLKSAGRPIQKEADRALLIAAMHFVDLVVVFEEDTPEKLIQLISPDVLVKGGDYKVEEIAGAQWVLDHGGKVELINYLDNSSSTNIIRKIREGL
ncbi:D-glycero-beta-D-manno-heptose 1-phosphate adenylyltransferase [Mucilaginibacter arboris]|uniref:D-glycero-beta-D-manno-heptose 1-phosphate adenylyltransferase n=1 Tax=Mucilaginibacter arboris TaxID=2682090 RepID=A0A7K1SVF3_9SPHI|nr:D-glycero-beta-D-manno-heptose 1-phosphate adenylyltransferase [Mucilaginibacter arboris]MVN21301.1 D-glycero-beta-D-manno-heptose 1-phosphate adenylyltransferase [Mucilaginibacter arboris]